MMSEEIRLPLSFVPCSMKGSYKVIQRRHQNWRIDEAVTGIKLQAAPSPIWSCTMHLCSIRTVLSGHFSRAFDPFSITHAPSQVNQCRPIILINMVSKLNNFVTTLSWESWAGACVMVNMSSAGVSSRKTRFLYNTDPFIHEGGKDHSICQIHLSQGLSCCVVPGLYVGVFGFVLFILYHLLIRFTSSNLYYIT